MKNRLVLLATLCLTFITYCQTSITLPDKLIQASSYNKMISEEFSYLVVGDNSPQQGASATLAADGSNIKLNATLYSGNYGIITAEADLTSSNGVYFFDDEKGGNKAKIGANYFKQLWSGGYYQTPSEIDQKVLAQAVISLLSDVHTKIDYYENKLSTFGSDPEILKKIVKLKATLKSVSNQYNITTYTTTSLTEYSKLHTIAPSNNITITNLKTTSKNANNKVTTSTASNNLSYTFNLNAVGTDFKKFEKFVNTKLKDSISNIERAYAKNYWGSKRLLFFNAKASYVRESFKRFTPDEAKSFKDMFSTTKGDRYVLEAGLNFSYQKGKGSSWFMPQDALVRASVSGGRASNFSSFTNQAINFSSEIGTDVNGNTIEITAVDAAFIGDLAYEFGTTSAFDLDIYTFPFKFPLGFFGELRYEYINFSSAKDIKDKELSPLRLGIMYTLTNKEKKKTYVVTKIFMDRTDLSLSPNGVDNDLRFGLAIGIPFNLR